MAELITTTISSENKTVKINRQSPTVIIGERINPTGRKKVLASLQAGNYEMIREDAIGQVEAGAVILDVNAGVPGADEVELLSRVIREVMEVVDVPLCIDTANPKALEAALKLYPAKPLINSVSGEEKSLKAVLPLAKEYGAAVIGLCVSDDGIPTTATERLLVAEKIIDRATSIGIPFEDVIIDPLAMAMGADHLAGRVSLDTARMIVEKFGLNVTMGASNISFGLPDRKYVNAAFLAMAIQAGLACPITNPLAVEIRTAVLAADLALGRDEYGMRWIKDFRKRKRA